MRTSLLVVLLVVPLAMGCSRPLRNAGLVTSAAMVGGGLYVAESAQCNDTKYCIDLGVDTMGSMLIVGGLTLALISVIASEMSHQRSATAPAATRSHPGPATTPSHTAPSATAVSPASL